MSFPIFPVVGIPVIFVLGFCGALFPSVTTHLFPKFKLVESVFFTFFNGMAAGLILAVGFVHSLASSYARLDAVITGNSLTDTYGWSAFAAMMGVIFTFTIEEVIQGLSYCCGTTDLHSHHHRKDLAEDDQFYENGDVKPFPLKEIGDVPESSSSDEEAQPTHVKENGHASKSLSSDKAQPISVENGHALELRTNEEAQPIPAIEENSNVSESQPTHDDWCAQPCSTGPFPKTERITAPGQEKLTGMLFKMFVLFFGLLGHNIFVGLALGTSENGQTLFIAIIFHQFFEGIALGSRVAGSKLKRLIYILVIDFIFASSCPICIGIGIGVKSAISSDLRAYDYFNGIVQGITAGMLIYVAIMHLIKAYQEFAPSDKIYKHRWISYIGILLGCATMSVIGIWA